MMAEEHKLLGQILKEMELVSEGQVQEALAIQRREGGVIGNVLVRLGYVTEDEILLALGAQVGMEVVSLDDLKIPRDALSKVPSTVAQMYKVIPIKFENEVLTLAMANPQNVTALDELREVLGCKVEGAVSDEAAVDRVLDKYYAGKVDSVGDMVHILGIDAKQSDTQVTDQRVTLENAEAMAEQAPVKRLLSFVLLRALEDKASDIHFEPFENDFKIRCRVDGILYDMPQPPLHLAPAIVSRIKILAKLNIAETRLPQDGPLRMTIAGRPVDIRVSTLPTMFGESVVLRLLDKESVALQLEEIGLKDKELTLIKKLLELPNGIIVVTGPTSSGKTTTLYSCLEYVNEIDWKIITTEDPVEYDIPGIIQSQVDPKIGVTYAACLRSILRQDPDMILVGEIRDQETGVMAIEASLTGHLVLTTLHTNDAPSTIIRMVELGLEPYLVTASLEAVIAQRLVRRICERCKEEIEPTADMLRDLELKPADVKDKKFYQGKGCSLCNKRGYKGRVGIFEIMIVNNKIKDLVMQQASTDQIRTLAHKQGMRTLRESGLQNIYEGITTVEEVVKATLFTA